MDEYIQARFQAGTASTSILEPLPLNACGDASNRTVEGVVEQTHRTQPSTVQPLSPQLPSFSWKVAYQKCSELVGSPAQVDCIIKDLVSWGKLTGGFVTADNHRLVKKSHYDRTEWLIIYDFCKKEASIMRDPKSLNNWSYNSAVVLERCSEAIAGRRLKRDVNVRDVNGTIHVTSIHVTGASHAGEREKKYLR